jgi:xylose isomerase
LRVVAYAAAQVRRCSTPPSNSAATNYVFWGGREGYMSLLNTDMKRELDHMAASCRWPATMPAPIGFKGSFYIEPKPMEPTKHQYDFDAATVIGFLRAYGLEKDFKLNIEANHASWPARLPPRAGGRAAAMGIFGSVDANRGDPRNGWDTDQFPIRPLRTTEAMLTILKAGGFTTGGLNFDAHIRRNSIDPADLFTFALGLAHIGGMDAFGRSALPPATTASAKAAADRSASRT